MDGINQRIYQAWGGRSANNTIKNVKHLLKEITFHRKRMDFYKLLNKNKVNENGLTLIQFKNLICFSNLINSIFNILKLLNAFQGKLIFYQGMHSIKLLIDEIFEFLIFFSKNNIENSCFLLNDQYLSILSNLINYYPEVPLILIYTLLMTLKKKSKNKLNHISSVNEIIEDVFQNVSITLNFRLRSVMM